MACLSVCAWTPPSRFCRAPSVTGFFLRGSFSAGWRRERRFGKTFLLTWSAHVGSGANGAATVQGLRHARDYPFQANGYGRRDLLLESFRGSIFKGFSEEINSETKCRGGSARRRSRVERYCTVCKFSGVKVMFAKVRRVVGLDHGRNGQLSRRI